MFATDIIKMVYSPRSTFKKIIENPKYWGALLVLLLFVGLQVAFDYAQQSKTYFEQTAPNVGLIYNWNSNTTLWSANSGVTVSNNYEDFINQTIYVGPPYYVYYSVFGNSSLQFDAANSNLVSVTLETSNVDCGPTGFQNLTLLIKIVQPQSNPQKLTLTLFTLNNSDSYFQQDLTSAFLGTSGIWNNLTIPVGTNTQMWQSIGNPSWSNITRVKLDFEFSTNTSVTINVGGLFFRSKYITSPQIDGGTVILNAAYTYGTQFIFEWIILTAIVYILIKLFKGSLIWKPLFIAIGSALAVLLIRSLIFLAATPLLPNVYYPYELAYGVSYSLFGTMAYPATQVSILSSPNLAVYNHIVETTLAFQAITEFAAIAIYAWLSGLIMIIISSMLPEFSLVKRMAVAVIGIVITMLLLIILIGVV
ncbi:MAG: hypothetical protein N3D85_02435 [Candidatus Bathyarchaeota archaeon]|nr:hypothetical protein [Candidatus Bathyarchaeota archaeon]